MKRTELNQVERHTTEDLLHRKINVTEIARYYGLFAQKTATETDCLPC